MITRAVHDFCLSDRLRRAIVVSWALGCSLWISWAVAVEFPGPIVLPQAGSSLSVLGVHVPGADRDYFASGSGDGFLSLNRYNPSSQFFTVLQRMVVGGQVVSITEWRLPDSSPVGLVVATANPDRLLFVRTNNVFPYFETMAEVALAEDPGAIAYTGAEVGGALELAVALPGLDRIVFVRQVAGQWSVVAETAVGDGVAALVDIDLDGDGVSELVAAQAGPLSRSLGILRRQPDNSYSLETINLPGLAPALVAAFDLDGDGRLELAVAGAEQPVVKFYNEVGGTLVEASQANLTITAETILLAAMPDGAAGLFVARGTRGLVEFAVLDKGLWRRGDTYYPGCLPGGLALADIDGDGVDDLLAVGGEAGVLTAMLGDGRPGFAGFPALGLDRSPGSFVSDDLDGDGRCDLVISDANETTLSLSLGLPEGELDPALASLELGFSPGFILGGDFTADPGPELAVLDIIAAELVILEYDPQVGLTPLSRTPVGSFPFFVAAGDLDADGALDLLVLSQASPEVAVLYGDGTGGVTQVETLGFENSAHWIVPLDLDGDGLLDLAATDARNRVWTLLNLGGRQFGNPSFVNAGSGALYMAAGDLDGDLDEDLVVANRTENSLSFFENDGSGMLVRQVGSHALPGQPAGLALADFNRDGNLDVLVNLKNEGILGLVLGIADWVYAQTTEVPGGPDMTGIGVADFNLDGVPDILVLDQSLLLGLTLLNGESGQVSVAPMALAAVCQGETLELRVRPDRPGPWRLELAEGSAWRGVMVNGLALIGNREFEGDTWVLHLTQADLGRWAIAGDGTLRARLTVGQGSNQESDVWTFAVGCGGAQPGALPRISWQRDPWPNPFNPLVRARIALEKAGAVQVAVFDLSGRQIAVLAAGDYPAGEIEVAWDGSSEGRPVAAGVYLLQATTPGGRLQSKLMLIK